MQHRLLPALLARDDPPNQQDEINFCYMLNLEQSMTLLSPARKRAARKFVFAAINGPLSSNDIRSTLLDGLKEDGDGIAAYNQWIKAGSDAWNKCLTSSTYLSVVERLSREYAIRAN